jgi:hypothetical protein
MGEIKTLLKQLLKENATAQTMPGIVTELDRTANTCTVAPADGSPDLFDVRLTASIDENDKVMVIYPALNSHVLVTIIGDNENVAFVSMCSEVEEVFISVRDAFKMRLTESGCVFDDGENGGLIVNQKLQAQIEKLNANFKILENIFDTWVPVPNDGGAALKVVAVSALQAMQEADLGDVTNDKVKH